MIKIFRNPFYVYVIAFLGVFIIYSLGWSSLYPDLTTEVKLFFIIIFLTFLGIGRAISFFNNTAFHPSKTKCVLLIRSFYLLLVLYVFEFIYEGDIPFFSLLRGKPGVSYMEFGIPLLHGILISFNSFLIAHSFSMYMASKRKKILYYNLLLYVPALLFLSRSIMVIGALTAFFIYIQYANKIRITIVIKVCFLIIIGLYFFGVLGNLRSGGDYFYTTSKAKKSFMSSSIPKEYYWTYLYASSPLANFQNTVDKAKLREYDISGFVYYEVMPKFFSKNFKNIFEMKNKDLERIVSWLTVGTTYAKSYSYLGWFGAYIMLFYNLAAYVVVILFFVPKKSNYRVTLVGILSVVMLLSVFSNMLIVTGISFQLVYCMLFSFFENKKWVIKKL